MNSDDSGNVDTYRIGKKNEFCQKLVHCLPDEEVVISGIAGSFPQSENVAEFGENLMAKKNLITLTDVRFLYDGDKVAKYACGYLKQDRIKKFDANFFQMSARMADPADPMGRIIMEKVYEAIFDAGYNPEELKETKTAVYVGVYFSEAEQTWVDEEFTLNGYGFVGCSRFSLANKISHTLRLKGNSCCLDTACSSSFTALDYAFKDLRLGICDAAIVAGCNLCITPFCVPYMYTLNAFNTEGRSAPFDASGYGYVKAETVAAALLQRKRNARRMYAQVVYSKADFNNFTNSSYGTPTAEAEMRLLKEFYEECGVKPSELKFVETHGTGTLVGDKEEARALEETLCRYRSEPLKIGTVKSNMGHSEAASGMCSLAKVILSYEKEVLIPNINFTKARPDILGLLNGKLSIVTEEEPWEPGLVGINNFGFGGCNYHVLLRPNPKRKINNGEPADELPRLVITSGRTRDAVTAVLNDFKSRPIDVEYVRLMQEINRFHVPRYDYRGYVVLKKDTSSKPLEQTEEICKEKRPVWFVFSGMGSQWPAMSKSLMKVPVIEESIRKCHEILKTKGMDLINVLTSDDPQVFENILYSFVGISTIQIALVDLLTTVGIVPDGMLGHSLGELGCGYADGCLTAEQMLLSAYYRGVVSQSTSFIKGSMASIGLSYSDIKDKLPSGIYVACHNGAENCTISGPENAVQKFVSELKDKGVFAREVKVSNIPFHSPYIQGAGRKLLALMKKIIPKPTPRSQKWICTSHLEADWKTDKAQFSSAEYYTNNLLSPVYFEEALPHLPQNAVVIEIAPHGLLQAILKRSLGKSSVNIPLMLRMHPDNTEFVFSALGRLFLAGHHPLVQKLYPPVEFPVSRGTPMIGPLIRWCHDEDRFVSHYRGEVKKLGRRKVTVCVKNVEHTYLLNHKIDQKPLYPAAGYLMLVWETFAGMYQQFYFNFSVRFEQVRFLRVTPIPPTEDLKGSEGNKVLKKTKRCHCFSTPNGDAYLGTIQDRHKMKAQKQGNIEFNILIQRGSGAFEIMEKDDVVVKGKIVHLVENSNENNLNDSENTGESNTQNINENLNTETMSLTSDDIYKELRLRGYHHEGIFKGVSSLNTECTVGRVKWEKNYVAFLDSVFHQLILLIRQRKLYVPSSIGKLEMNMKKHQDTLAKLDPEKPEFTVYANKTKMSIRCGGIEIFDFNGTHIPRKKANILPILRKIEFMPFVQHLTMDIQNTIRVFIQIVIQNISTTVLKTLEVIDESYNPEKSLISEILFTISEEIPLIKTNMTVLTNDLNHPLHSKEMKNIAVTHGELPKEESYAVIFASRLSDRKQDLEKYTTVLEERGFVVTRERAGITPSFKDMEICCDYGIGEERLLLLRKTVVTNAYGSPIRITSDSYAWLPEVRNTLNVLKQNENGQLILFAEREKYNGILGLVNCLLREYGINKLKCFFIMDETAPPFSISHPLYKAQLAKDMPLNVYKNASWGVYANVEFDSLTTRKAVHAFVKTLTKGNLRTINWVEGPLDPLTYKPAKNRELVFVYYSPLNFRDVMLATGRLSNIELDEEGFDDEIVHGFEFSGKLQNGRRVMGITDKMGMATLVDANKSLLWDVPNEWTLEDAATVPIVYATVLCALFRFGNIQRGESILIHAGTGGIGQAAINICLYYECTVFTTVGTPEKRQFIRKTFPTIPESHIGNSRDTSFKEMIMKETNGKGVDLVLNSLAEEKLLVSLSCLGTNGRFLEIGLFDIYMNNPLGLEHFKNEISFHSVILTKLIDADDETKSCFFRLFQEFLNNGAIKPLTRTLFPVDEIEKAFRYLAGGKHMGKVIVKIRDENDDANQKPQTVMLDARRRLYCPEEKSYIICGGLGGLGLELTDWLILRGAKKIVLSSRNGITTGYQAYRMKIWKQRRATVVISTENIAEEAGVQKLIQTANSLGPVSAIFNLAVVLDDKLFEDQTEDSFRLSAGSKAIASLHLDRLSRKMCPNLDYFVLFSSLSCGYGNVGQTNYAMANSVMERICEQRFADKLPALAIEWGPMGDVGVMTKNAEAYRKFRIGGMEFQTVISFLEVMDYFITQPNPLASSFVVADKKFSQGKKENLLDEMAQILGIQDIRSMDPNMSLVNYGLDSMTAVELKQILETNYNMFLTPDALKTATFGTIFELQRKLDADAGILTSFVPSGKSQVSELLKTLLAGTVFQLEEIKNENSVREPIVKIPTIKDDKAIPPKQSSLNVFAFPGIEGLVETVKPFCSNINARISCFQYPSLNNFQTIEDVAKELVKHVKNVLQENEDFIFVAYSFGSLIAVEVAKILENEGKTGKIYSIDCPIPNYYEDCIKQHVANEDRKELEMEILIIEQYLSFLAVDLTEEMKEQLRELPDRSSRLERLETMLPANSEYDRKQVTLLFAAGIHKLNLLFTYGELKKLSKTTGIVINLKQRINEDLKKYNNPESCFKPPVKTFVIENDHSAGEIIYKDIVHFQKEKIDEKILNMEDQNLLRTLPVVI